MSEKPELTPLQREIFSRLSLPDRSDAESTCLRGYVNLPRERVQALLGPPHSPGGQWASDRCPAPGRWQFRLKQHWHDAYIPITIYYRADDPSDTTSLQRAHVGGRYGSDDALWLVAQLFGLSAADVQPSMAEVAAWDYWQPLETGERHE